MNRFTIVVLKTSVILLAAIAAGLSIAWILGFISFAIVVELLLKGAAIVSILSVLIAVIIMMNLSGKE